MFRYFVGNGQTFVRASGEPSVQKTHVLTMKLIYPCFRTAAEGREIFEWN